MGGKRIYRIRKDLQYWFFSNHSIVIRPNVAAHKMENLLFRKPQPDDYYKTAPTSEKKKAEELAKEVLQKHINRLTEERASMLEHIKVLGEALDEEKVSILDEGYECRWDCQYELLAAA